MKVTDHLNQSMNKRKIDKEAEEQADKQEQHKVAEKKKKKKKKKKNVAKEIEDLPPARRKSYTPSVFEKKFSSPLKLTLVRIDKNKKRKQLDVPIPLEEQGEHGKHEKEVLLPQPVALGEKLRCKHCTGAYSSLYNLKRHMKDMHSITDDQDMKGMVDKKSFCIYCTT